MGEDEYTLHIVTDEGATYMFEELPTVTEPDIEEQALERIATVFRPRTEIYDTERSAGVNLTEQESREIRTALNQGRRITATFANAFTSPPIADRINQSTSLSDALKDEIRKLIRDELESEGYILGRVPDELSGFEELIESGGSAR